VEGRVSVVMNPVNLDLDSNWHTDRRRHR